MFECEFCGRAFQRESSLLVHMCEIKRRHSERGERGVELGLQAYLRFYETLQGSSRLKSWDDFVASNYYRAFVKWGRYCVSIKAIRPERWLEWLLKHNKKIDRWATDAIYSEYLLGYLPWEPVKDALDRAEAWSLDWSDRSNAPANHCLRYGNANAICHAVTTGHMSAWILYNCDSGRQFLAELDPSNRSMIWPYIDSDVWERRFNDCPADQIWVENLLSAHGW